MADDDDVDVHLLGTHLARVARVSVFRYYNLIYATALIVDARKEKSNLIFYCKNISSSSSGRKILMH